MPTRSDPPPQEWAARPTGARVSVFSNYRASADFPAVLGPAVAQGGGNARSATNDSAAAYVALARSFVYRFLAQAYADPNGSGWEWLGEADTHAGLQAAWALVKASSGSTGAGRPEGVALPEFRGVAQAAFGGEYVAAFGHAARGRCPLNEIEYGDLKADPLFQPHRLADLAAFYRAFGLEICETAGERHDHICVELEFMTVLTAMEAYALDQKLNGDQLEIGRDAQKQFLREHLGRWTPAFTRRLVASARDATLKALAEFTRGFVESECERYGVPCGSEDLLLRPADEASESLCASCNLFPTPNHGPAGA